MISRPINKHALRSFVVLAVVLLAAGCARSVTNGPSDAEQAKNLEEWVANVKAKRAPPLEPVPVLQQFETFEYAAQSERDPFSSAFLVSAANSGPRPDTNRRKQTLEQYPLDSLDMVGTLGKGKAQVALVMAPDKVTYRVTPGVYMGQNDGRVVGVYEDRIELIELVPDGAGGWLERPASVALDNEK